MRISFVAIKKNEASNTQLVKKIISRSVYLFVLGLLLNAFPTHFDISTLRILGVLQRIALCYCGASLLYLTTRIQTQLLIITIILIGYWALIAQDSYSMSNNIVGYVDSWILSPKHLYTQGFDPEGLLSTFPALASTLLGTLLGIA